MLQVRKQITLSGGSVVARDGNEVTVATMFATLAEDGRLNSNSTIINKELYLEHADEVDTDIAAFQIEAASLVKEED